MYKRKQPEEDDQWQPRPGLKWLTPENISPYNDTTERMYPPMNKLEEVEENVRQQKQRIARNRRKTNPPPRRRRNTSGTLYQPQKLYVKQSPYFAQEEEEFNQRYPRMSEEEIRASEQQYYTSPNQLKLTWQDMKNLLIIAFCLGVLLGIWLLLTHSHSLPLH